MSTAAETPLPDRAESETPDETISRAVWALLGYHRMVPNDLVTRIDGLKSSTLYRRLNGATWEAREVKAIAEFFGLPIGQFFTGHIEPAASKLPDPHLRLSLEHETAGQDRFSGSDIALLCDAQEMAETSAA